MIAMAWLMFPQSNIVKFTSAPEGGYSYQREGSTSDAIEYDNREDGPKVYASVQAE